jgi:hypothetical protein
MSGHHTLAFSQLALRLKPVLIRLAIAATSLLVAFVGTHCDLRYHIDRFLGQ